MFPLGTVLFPFAVLPLHVFESRYLRMMADCLDNDREFGVVLIERGSEVGGDDDRFGIGTLAHVAATSDLGDDRLAVVAIGVSRIEVREWLPDDPYPEALVVPRTDGDAIPLDAAQLQATAASLRRLLALLSELGRPVGDLGFALHDDPRVAVYQLCSLAPLTALDAQALLETDSLGRRLEMLSGLIADETYVAERRLEGL